jgi:hypothetical protein
MQGPMLKVAPPQCLIIESFIYISCCRKYIRMMNGLRPFAELCMDVCYADKVDLSRRGCYLSRQASKIMHETSSIVPIDL